MFRKLANLFSPPLATDDLASVKREHTSHLLASETISVTELTRFHPPKIEHEGKRLLFSIAPSGGASGDTSVSRFRSIPVPHAYRVFRSDTDVSALDGHIRYEKTSGADDWFMNFAHHDLFSGYGHFMFAQDEIQVAEHPALASFRELMLERTDSLRPKTVEDGAPTPVVFRDVPRVVSIDTRKIYGARFSRATADTIRDAVRPLDSPTNSNILAIEAPISSGNRIYVRGEIEAALRTAYSGFRAIVLSSQTVAATCSQPVAVHTGNWGCGAYGGNRQLMISIQIMAARLAGLSKLLIYCGTDSKKDVTTFNAELARRFKFKPGVAIGRVVDRLVGAAFEWGTPDGN